MIRWHYTGPVVWATADDVALVVESGGEDWRWSARLAGATMAPAADSPRPSNTRPRRVSAPGARPTESTSDGKLI